MGRGRGRGRGRVRGRLGLGLGVGLGLGLEGEDRHAHGHRTHGVGEHLGEHGPHQARPAHVPPEEERDQRDGDQAGPVTREAVRDQRVAAEHTEGADAQKGATACAVDERHADYYAESLGDTDEERRDERLTHLVRVRVRVRVPTPSLALTLALARALALTLALTLTHLELPQLRVRAPVPPHYARAGGDAVAQQRDAPVRHHARRVVPG